MASTPVTAPSQQPPPTPPVSSPPPETKSPPPPETKSPPPEAKSPPPEATSPPPEAKSPPPKALGSPPPSTTSPPQQPEPEPTPKPSSPPQTSLPTPSAPTAGNTTPQTPPSPKTPSQNAAPSPPIPSNNNPISLPPPSEPKHTPSSGELSPPHAPEHRTPSSSSTPSNDRSSLSPESDSVTEKLPLIVGVAAGVGMLCVIMILVCLVCSKKKKKKKSGSLDQVQYYSDPRNGPKGYYDNGTEQQQNWYNNNNPQMMNQSPQGYMGPPGGGWPQRHQSPTPQLSSEEMSSDPHYASVPSQSPGGNMGFSKSTFTYDELAAATNGFSQANLLGQGGFGYVHKGILPNGKVVAVKSLKSGSGQGEREFQAEVEIISRVHHRHLVSLVGYCIAGAQRMLVYEFVPNGTMEYHLHGKDCPTMEWHKRLTIALGSAKGLAYLHEDCHPRIIHRDIKAANILIDNNFEAMVADFGLAKLSQDNITHVSTRVMGTFGYLAPEYASSGKLSEKSDVFSFGVMLLELITGRKPVDTTNSYMDDSLVDWARPIMTQALSDGNFDELVDPLLNNIYNVNEMERMIACAAASIRHSSRRRPKMSQIVRALEGDVSLEALNEGVIPGKSSAFTSSSDSYDTTSYNADLKKFRKMALGTSTEYSGVTSTYGLNPSTSSDSSSGEVNHPGTTRPKY